MSFIAEMIFLAILVVFRKREKRALVGAVLIVGLAAVLVSWLGIGAAMERFASYKGLEVSEGRRVGMLHGTWRIFLDHPVLGTGLGTLQEIFPRYETVYDGLIVNHTHNDYAEALAETGAAGGICFFAFLVLLFWNSWKNLAGCPDAGDLAYHAGALVGCFGLLVHSFVDFNFHIPSNALVFLLLAALATSVLPLSSRSSPQRRS
jgi:O-antigen ligase